MMQFSLAPRSSVRIKLLGFKGQFLTFERRTDSSCQGFYSKNDNRRRFGLKNIF